MLELLTDVLKIALPLTIVVFIFLYFLERGIK
jgi:hypothetical protein